MFMGLIARGRRNRRIAADLYGAIVAQARASALYAILGVPDTVDGRFEMVVLHTVVVLDRLNAGGAAGRTLGQRVFDLFCADMDGSLRDLGVGDLAVPKHMKHLGGRYYARAAAYGRVLADGDADGLAAALDDSVYAGVPGAGRALARYVVAAAVALAAEPPDSLHLAPPTFPDPAAFAEEVAA